MAAITITWRHRPPSRPTTCRGAASSRTTRGCGAILKPLFPGYVRHCEVPCRPGPLTYDTYGFRVPAVIVSPYARPDCVLSEVFDHTSVLKLVEEKRNLPALTRRDAAAISPIGAVDLVRAARVPHPAGAARRRACRCGLSR